ncbi:MAG: glycosyl hydrolase family 18 protein [Lachnospiraceae bacterium]
MKRLIPFFCAIILIIIIGVVSLLSGVFDRFSYSDVKRDLLSYFNIQGDEVALIIENEIREEKAYTIDEVHYLKYNDIKTMFNDRFFYDFNEGLLLYTTPTQIIKTTIGDTIYTVDQELVEEDYVITRIINEELYVAIDYVNKYTNFTYEVFANPTRIQIKTNAKEIVVANIKKDTQVRYQGGIKSDILRELVIGEEVIVLEELENWSKIITNDALIGYVENKRLENKETKQEEEINVYVMPEYSDNTRDYTINLGWHQVMSVGANATIHERIKDTKSMNVISPTWYSLNDNNGNFTSLASQDYVRAAHENGLEVWALIDNFNANVSTCEVLTYTSKRERLIKGVIEETLKYGIDGINLDFEEVSYDAGEAYVQFIRELSIQCRLNNIVLSIDNYVPRESTTHYNRKEQGIVADYVIIMGYDEHWGGGGVAGSVASIKFVEDGIQRTINEVPSRKVINAVPFYTRVWKTEGNTVTSEAVGMEVASSFIERNAVEVFWDEETCQNYGEIQIDNIFYQVWLEDEKSIETKLTIMKKYDLGGVAAWKLGFETPTIWNVIAAYVNN